MQSLDDIWKLTLEELKKEFSETTMKLWFNDLIFHDLDDSTVILICDSEFKRTMIENKQSVNIQEALSKVLGFEVDVKLIGSYDEVPAAAEKRPTAAEPTEIFTDDDFEKDERESSAIDSSGFIRQSKNEYTFDTFIVGASNNFAHAACFAVAMNPSDSLHGYNPLFIYGPSGLGKTHLLYATSNKILEFNPSAKIIYVRGEEFTNELVEAIMKGKGSASSEANVMFREKYRNVDVLMIDDIQFIAGKEGTQEEFFHTFNALYEKGKQIIMTSDRPPKDIKTLEDRLKTRFEWGITADITLPDFELRYAIMKNKAMNLGLNVPDEVFNFLAENLRSNVRQLEGAIKKLGAQSFLNKVDITLELAVSCTSDLLTGSEPPSVTIEKILEKTAKKYGITTEDLKGRKRTSDISNPRHIAVYLIRKLTDMSLPNIGKIFGRDHTTIMSSIENIEIKLKANSLFEIEVNDLIKEIKE